MFFRMFLQRLSPSAYILYEFALSRDSRWQYGDSLLLYIVLIISALTGEVTVFAQKKFFLLYVITK